MKTRIGLLGLLVLGACGNDPTAAVIDGDAGTGGALTGDAGPVGTGGMQAVQVPDGSAGDAGAAPADAGGAGGAMTADAGAGGTPVGGSGGAGSGGAQGSGGAIGTGGVSGSGGSAGTGGAPATAECVDPMGWNVIGEINCVNSADKTTKKDGRACTTGCQSVRPNGQAGNYIGPPMHPECWTTYFVCVASCAECS